MVGSFFVYDFLSLIILGQSLVSHSCSCPFLTDCVGGGQGDLWQQLIGKNRPTLPDLVKGFLKP